MVQIMKMREAVSLHNLILARSYIYRVYIAMFASHVCNMALQWIAVYV